MTEDAGSQEPSMSEAFFYGGIGVAGAFLLVMAVGLSIIGFHVSSDSRDDRLDREDAAAADSQADEGADLFSRRCASCHGPAGEGGAGPAFAGVVERIPTVEEHEAIVRDGRAQMPSFENVLSDEQISLVVAYERDVLNTP